MFVELMPRLMFVFLKGLYSVHGAHDLFDVYFTGAV